MILSFTGTRRGMKPAQYERVFFAVKQTAWTRAVHGCCHGSDREFHDLTSSLAHDLFPSNEEQHQWALQNSFGGRNVIYPIMPPIERDKKMVDLGNTLIATPGGMQEIVHSGTWTTIRYARRIRRHTIICWPDGTVTEEFK